MAAVRPIGRFPRRASRAPEFLLLLLLLLLLLQRSAGQDRPGRFVEVQYDFTSCLHGRFGRSVRSITFVRFGLILL